MREHPGLRRVSDMICEKEKVSESIALICP